MGGKFKVNISELDAFADTCLRDYQVEAKKNIYNFWKTKRSVMLQMPTGTGKTRLFVSIAKDFHNWAVKNKTAVKILFLAHRHELIDQIDTHLGIKYGLAHGIIMAKNMELKKYPVQIGSVPTLTRRIDRWVDKQFDIIIIDEAHHVKAESYKKIIKAFPYAKVLGVTATPYRLNGEGFMDEFEGLIVSEPINSFIKKGYLSEYEYYSIRPDSILQTQINSINQFDIDGDYLESAMISVMDTEKVRAKIVDTYLKFARGKKGIVYSISKGHNLHIRNNFIKVGVKAEAIDCDTKPEEREKIVNAFKTGKIDVLCNVNIFSEGFDCPDVEFVQLARPTMSLSMYLQQVGRGLRPAEGKDKLIVLDNVGQYNKFGFPSADRNWMAYFKGQDEIQPDPIHMGDGRGIAFIEEIEEGNEYVDLLYSSQDMDSNTIQMEKDENIPKANRTIKDIEKEIEVFKKYGSEVPQQLLQEKRMLEDLELVELVVRGIVQSLMQKYDIHRDAMLVVRPFGKSMFKYTDNTENEREREVIDSEIGIFEKYGTAIPEELFREKKKLENSDSFREEVLLNIQSFLHEFDWHRNLRVMVKNDGTVVIELCDSESQGRIVNANFGSYNQQPICQKENHQSQEGKKSNFKFSMVGIKLGETLIFEPTKLKVTVASDNEVMFMGKLYKLTAFVKEYLPEQMRNQSGSYRGPNYFLYNGVSLTDLRETKEGKKEEGKRAKQHGSNSSGKVYNRNNWTTIQEVKVGDEIEGLGVVTEKYSRDELYPNSAAMVIINGKKWVSPQIKDFLGLPRNPKVTQKNQGKRKAPLTFSMIGINIGETLVFEPTKIKVTIVSDNEISYLGKRYKLSAFVKEFYPKERQYNSGAYQGSRFFSYKGRILEDIRQEKNK